MKVSRVYVRNGIPNLQGVLVHDAAAAITQVAEEVMTDSKLNYVPVVSGNLRMSGHVQRAEIVDNVATVVLGYGGATAVGVDVTYALKVHEAPPHIGQGKNKYLVQPLYAVVPRLTGFIGSFIQQRMNARSEV